MRQDHLAEAVVVAVVVVAVVVVVVAVVAVEVVLVVVEVEVEVVATLTPWAPAPTLGFMIRSVRRCTRLSAPGGGCRTLASKYQEIPENTRKYLEIPVKYPVSVRYYQNNVYLYKPCTTRYWRVLSLQVVAKTVQKSRGMHWVKFQQRSEKLV